MSCNDAPTVSLIKLVTDKANHGTDKKGIWLFLATATLGPFCALAKYSQKGGLAIFGGERIKFQVRYCSTFYFTDIA